MTIKKLLNRQHLDKLSNPIKLHYQDKIDNPQQDILHLQKIIAQGQGIREGLKTSYKRRTYHKDYVSVATDKPKTRHINSFNQLTARKVEIVAEYCTDEYQSNKVQACIIQLTGRNHQEVWVYGYQFSDWDGATVVLDPYLSDSEQYDNRTDAEIRVTQCAKQLAECVAEQCYEEEKKYQTKQTWHELNQECLKLIREYKQHKATLSQGIKDLIMDNIRELLSDRKQLYSDNHYYF